MSYNRGRRNFTLGIFLGILAMLAWQYGRAWEKNSTLGMPQDETAFVTVLTQSRAAWLAAPNDLARLGMRQARAAALCKANPQLLAHNWRGRILSVTPNAMPDFSGKQTATIVIALTTDITLATPALPLLNSPSSLVEAGTPIYTTAATLRAGQDVRFSGQFFSGGDCVDEESFTLTGGMTEPRLKIQLTALAAG